MFYVTSLLYSESENIEGYVWELDFGGKGREDGFFVSSKYS